MANKFQKVYSYYHLDDFSLKNLRKGDLLRYRHNSTAIDGMGLEPDEWSFGVFVNSLWYVKTDWKYMEEEKEIYPPEIGIVYDLEIIDLNCSKIIYISTKEYDIEKLISDE